ncbi:TIGR02530 family flagellar biosynthesis protein [Aliibacillus thermotolerans]|uniref:TIGR02530 family flagellar biosynthesis protein n=1 Tax=Aliibacillus thermotolerans TaxID=1834418 RepID=A0ABW0U531_9BACI|nr:TIGR02530 family flagellar biosynthesis protein [Aliibacillus thermotolerans]MDA3130609.1 flagellar protein [Aliibacillus thermotolerans]
MSHIPIKGFHSLPPLPTQTTNKTTKHKETSFQNVLEQQMQLDNPLKLSKHAQKRLQERDVVVTASEWEHISKKVMEAKDKGVTDSVVLTKEAALVVSAKNNTVITAMKREEATSHIFTNINGTIVV